MTTKTNTQTTRGSFIGTALKTATAITVIGIAGAGGFLLSDTLNAEVIEPEKQEVTETVEAAETKDTALPWVAAAPGRVEPKSGEIQVGTTLTGRVMDVVVEVKDEVEDGELLVRLDDAEARARLAAAETKAEALEKSRDDAKLDDKREAVRDAEDAVYWSERAVTGARLGLDELLISKRKGDLEEKDLTISRNRLKNAEKRLQRARTALATAKAKPRLPAPSNIEASLGEARAQVALAQALFDNTRIRASVSGQVLKLKAKKGEIVSPAAPLPLAVIGDMSSVRVKAEVDEADVAKLKLGQTVTVRSASYPGQSFEGKVAKLAPTLAKPRIGRRGPRRMTDVEVLEVAIDLDGSVPLLPGMRADAYFQATE